MKTEVFQAALAGLLHDIGKFEQRAKEGTGQAWTPEARERHAEYSGAFVERYLPRQWQAGLTGPAGHHQPQSHHNQVTALAGLLSVGQPADELDRSPRQLLSIFSAIELVDEAGQSLAAAPHSYLPLAPLQLDLIFPGAEIPDPDSRYQALWRDFSSQAEQLKTAHEHDQADPPSYLAGLLKLMQRYTWAIPAGDYSGRPDISLYDHSRMAAALAACMIEQDEGKIAGLLQNPDQSEPVALLVGGDISGVQKFIYTITSRGATGGLRGRSIYLQFLTDVAARYLLNHLGLPLTNLIYAGGGHFYLLAPLHSAPALAEAQRHISRVLLHHHQGDLYLALAQETLEANQFLGPAFADRWRALTQGLQRAKQRQFAELGPELPGLLFEPHEQGGDQPGLLCAVCQREHPQARAIREEETGQEEPVKCPACRSFEALGDDLRQARYLYLDEIEPAPLPAKGSPAGDWPAVLAHFGYRVWVSDSPAPAAGQFVRRTGLALTDAALIGLAPQARLAVGRHFLVNVTPLLSALEYDRFKEKGLEDLPRRFNPQRRPIKTFEIMAEQALGLKRLGILRMDVDNLGRIFSSGLGERANLARVAGLSFAMSLFFEGWLARITADIAAAARPEEPPQDLIYSIYSGGDDLFIVGAWDLMPLLAERINHDLGRYSGRHPGIHLSGGIVLAGSKYPLYQAAEEAHKAEQAAKANQAGGQAKNALNFLGQTIPWGRFGEVKRQQEQLVELVAEKGAPKTLLQRLNQLYAEYAEANRALARQGQAEKVYWGPWHWHSAYSLGRLADRHKAARAEIKEIRDALNLENFKNIEWIGLAARWAELLTRQKGD